MAHTQVKERLSKCFNSGGLISGVRWLSLQKHSTGYYLEDYMTNAQQLLLSINEVNRRKQ